MKKLALLLSLLAPTLNVAQSSSGHSADRTWISDVIIVSPESLNHVTKGSVLIENGVIARVERGPAQKPPPGAVVVAGEGQYLIPGLIDSHVHLASIPGMVAEQEEKNPQLVRVYLEQMPRSYLYFGYTTLVDLAVSEPKVLEDFRRAPLHPDLYDCGGSLPFANGYPMSFAPPGTRFKPYPNFVYDPKQADRIPPEYKPEDHAPAADVARVKASGAICVKTYFERGFADDKNLPVMGADVLAEVRKAATANKLVLMIHANAFEAQKFGADGNVDVIAHGMWHWKPFDNSREVPDEIKHTLDEIVAKKIGYQPTIQVLYGELAYFQPEYLHGGSIPKVTPKTLLDWFRSPDGQWFGKLLGEGKTPNAEMVNMYEKGPLRRVRQATAYLASKDANFVFGTDTPSSPTYGNLPGLNGYLEMRELHKAGLSLTQIFKAATINNAREFKLESQLGTIQPGRIANLVLMKKSPLDTIDAYDSITTLWIHGKQVAREDLAADSRH